MDSSQLTVSLVAGLLLVPCCNSLGAGQSDLYRELHLARFYQTLERAPLERTADGIDIYQQILSAPGVSSRARGNSA